MFNNFVTGDSWSATLHGSLFIVAGALFQKRLKSWWLKESAKTFKSVLMWCAKSRQLALMPSNVKMWINFMHWPQEDAVLLTMCTTASLSQKIVILVLVSLWCLPQVMIAAVSANNSKNSMLGLQSLIKLVGHLSAIHMFTKVALKPKISLLEASEKKLNVSELLVWSLKSTNGLQSLKLFPLRNCFHMSQSFRNSHFNHKWWNGFNFLLLVPAFNLVYIPLVKALPGTMARFKKLRVPLSFWMNFTVTLHFFIAQLRRFKALIFSKVVHDPHRYCECCIKFMFDNELQCIRKGLKLRTTYACSKR